MNTLWFREDLPELVTEAGERVGRLVLVRKGRTRTLWKRDHTDDVTATATFARLVAALGLDEALRVCKAAPGGTLPDVRHGHHLWARARFEKMWGDHDHRKPFPTGRVVMTCAVPRRTAVRWVGQKKNERSGPSVPTDGAAPTLA